MLRIPCEEMALVAPISKRRASVWGEPAPRACQPPKMWQAHRNQPSSEVGYLACELPSCGSNLMNMTWYNKEARIRLDEIPVEGVFFLDSDLAAKKLPLFHLLGMKCPMIAFPSGEACPIAWDREDSPQVYLFPGMDLPLYDTYPHALQRALEQAEDAWFTVFGNGENQLELWSHLSEEVFFVTYDNEQQRMVDLEICAA